MSGSNTQVQEVYAERANVVALAVKLANRLGYEVGAVRDEKEPDWPVVMIVLPTGQVSWHFSLQDFERCFPDGLPEYPDGWDGHTTEQKYRRIADLPADDADVFESHQPWKIPDLVVPREGASVPPVQSDADRLLERAWKDVAELRATGFVGGSHAQGVADRIAKLIALVRAGVQPDAPPAAPACELHERGDDGLCITCRRPMPAPPAESVQQEPDADPPEWTAFMQHIGSCQQCQDNVRPLCARGFMLHERGIEALDRGVPTVPAPVTGE